ncbi:peptide deformylase [Brevibacillus agri]|uniref:peptide deformylase n=1 Tax=Brevibacillus TaxID=55080 RepID=UPI000271CC48|nr:MULTISPECIES: peptide deformylase [Brevibacillus]ELK42962.1 peptide deformylase [Brevibacillus agri BAB-2500]EJL44121.1 peptide deformylase [Brevibacillus sp. CF112]MBG9564492.1 peptide deformylase [Brevibacillus agri]MBY0053137.1 peptide deformylase [Brevibacillus agri]MCG5253975.1 peptide deformylase [Brevibacillus agri]
MAERTIVRLGDPVLRERSRRISSMTPHTEMIAEDMKQTLYAKKGRAGLSAVQIGVPLRLIVIDCGSGLIELINPEIVEMSGVQVGPEACLSIPGVVGIVSRSRYVKVKSQNRRGEPTVLEAEDFLARCVQHEIDHLEGVLFIDHVEALYSAKTGKPLRQKEANAILAYRRETYRKA